MGVQGGTSSNTQKNKTANNFQDQSFVPSQ